MQPKTTSSYLDQELKDWANFGVEGHFKASNPWMPYHEFLSEGFSKIVGAKLFSCGDEYVNCKPTLNDGFILYSDKKKMR